MKENKNIWLLKNGIDDVEKDLINLFSADGFKVDCSAESTDAIKISANNKVKLPRLFFQLKRPEIIKCSLHPNGPYTTHIELSYEHSNTFITFIYLALTITASIMFVPIYIATSYPDVDIVSSICIPISFTGYCAFMYVLFRIMINDHYRILFKSLKAQGHALVVIERTHITKYTRNCVLFVFILLALLCFPLSLTKPQFTVFFYAVIGIGLGAFLCSQASLNKIARSPHFIVLLFFATTFAIYGIFPILTLVPPITTSSLIFLCVSIILIFVILAFLKNTMLMFLESVNIIRKNPEEIRFNEKQSIPIIIFVVTVWLLLNIGCFISFVASVNLLEYCILGKNYIFSETAAHNLINGIAAAMFPAMKALRIGSLNLALIRLFFIVYLSPILIIVIYIISSNIKQFVGYIKTLMSRRHYQQKQFRDIKNIVKNIAKDRKIRKPYLRVIDSENINAYCILPLIPLTRNIITVTTASCEKLSQETMEALIAHEMGHLHAKHSSIFSLLNFFSRWTFLGEGFASMLAKNSKIMETEADKFAVLWLEKNSATGRKALLELLRTQEKQRIKASMSPQNKDSFHGLPAFKMNWKVEQLINESKSYTKKKFFRKRLFDCQLLAFFIFHGWLSTYMHVSYDERIKYIDDFKSEKG